MKNLALFAAGVAVGAYGYKHRAQLQELFTTAPVALAPLDQPTTKPEPFAGVSKEDLTFADPTVVAAHDEFTFALREDGTEVRLSLYDPEYGAEHILAGGSAGSGKSNLHRLVIAETAASREIVRWGLDVFGGMAFRPLAPLFDWLITDQSETLAFFTAARAVVEARAKYAAERGWQNWKADKDHPLLVIHVDDTATPFGIGEYETVEMGKVLAQHGQTTGVKLLLSTQHASNEAIGSQQIAKNMGTRIAFSCADTHQQNLLLPNSTSEMDATQIPHGKKHAGKGYWSRGGELDTRMIWVRHVTAEKMRELVAKYSGLRVTLDAGSGRAVVRATPAYSARKVWRPES